jgi:hypothetical protein
MENPSLAWRSVWTSDKFSLKHKLLVLNELYFWTLSIVLCLKKIEE